MRSYWFVATLRLSFVFPDFVWNWQQWDKIKRVVYAVTLAIRCPLRRALAWLKGKACDRRHLVQTITA